MHEEQKPLPPWGEAGRGSFAKAASVESPAAESRPMVAILGGAGPTGVLRTPALKLAQDGGPHGQAERVAGGRPEPARQSTVQPDPDGRPGHLPGAGPVPGCLWH